MSDLYPSSAALHALYHPLHKVAVQVSTNNTSTHLTEKLTLIFSGKHPFAFIPNHNTSESTMIVMYPSAHN